MAESLAVQSKTKCVVFLTGTDTHFVEGFSRGWHHAAKEYLGESLLNKLVFVTSAEGGRSDMNTIKMCDIMIVYLDRQNEKIDQRVIFQLGAARMAQKPVFVADPRRRLDLNIRKEIGAFNAARETYLKDLMADVAVEAGHILIRKQRETRNA